jgi:tRNA (guanine-N7-)-methyltransferase
MTNPRPPIAEGVPNRLYGRRRGHPLRPRQQLLMEQTLPRLRLTADQAATPHAAFAQPVQQLWLEVGFGGGEHALDQHAANPGVGYIASEVFENGLCSLLTRLAPEGEEATASLPPTLRLWNQDARQLLHLLPDACLDRLFLMFPDPWPKLRHAKRRFVQPTMFPLLARVLKPGATWRIASDDPTYQTWVTESFQGQTLFSLPDPATTRPAGWPPTRYEQKALREGRQPLYWQAVRR